ncbi:MAG: class II fructose-bisphosphate aldolase [Lachnospiraceae bacterium]|jgi:fructose-bisphosphate aldolase class II|nr:class II fructose-bisphosphate aldolase [Lachnospiraceae bacterium]
MKAEQVVLKARKLGKCIPAFNCPHIPMVKPIAQAITDENSVAMIQVARVEWEKFESESLERISEEYAKYRVEGHTLLHLDHIPVIDEDYLRVDYMDLISRALKAGYESVMIDGSRLKLEENIKVTAEAAALAHEAGVPIEAELGAVMGHENKEMPPYEEIFSSKMGFTRLDEAKRFAAESKCDWLSVAVGNIHGQVAEAVRNQKKPEARIDIEHVAALYHAAGIPLVLHGGSGIKHESVLEAVGAGISKINVGTEVRQCYEFALKEKPGDIGYAQERVYLKTRDYIKNYMYNSNLADEMKNR